MSKYIGLPAVMAIEMLQEANIKFTIDYTVPPRGFHKVDTANLYIIREKAMDGCVHLIAAAKMLQEE